MKYSAVLRGSGGRLPPGSACTESQSSQRGFSPRGGGRSSSLCGVTVGGLPPLPQPLSHLYTESAPALPPLQQEMEFTSIVPRFLAPPFWGPAGSRPGPGSAPPRSSAVFPVPRFGSTRAGLLSRLLFCGWRRGEEGPPGSPGGLGRAGPGPPSGQGECCTGPPRLAFSPAPGPEGSF